ncbi:response regulator transcription factor [Marinibactrum halimedae]|nr:response regulator transcription factor [Marinibactrum halimedae]
MNRKILVVEDQEDINALIAMNLEAINFEVTRVHDGLEGLKLAQEDSYAAIVLDIMLPGLDGLQICQQLRSKGHVTPILMLTAKKTEADRVVGLEVGADDYLTKPFSVLELQARVKALLRRVEFHSHPVEEEVDEGELRLGDLTIHQHKRDVIMGGKPVSLTGKEFDLLLYLASFPGRVFSREQLLNAVWGYQHSSYEHTVNSHINRLRAKLETDPSNPQYVLTVWGVGYKFNDDQKPR